jgi:hypothetical protein
MTAKTLILLYQIPFQINIYFPRIFPLSFFHLSISSSWVTIPFSIRSSISAETSTILVMAISSVVTISSGRVGLPLVVPFGITSVANEYSFPSFHYIIYSKKSFRNLARYMILAACSLNTERHRIRMLSTSIPIRP